ncbi:alpha-L-fucosidase [Virgibacillus siamensis]|uniref:alpha-L-fucosidase n=1 Tax=Virgibacillus siamensis TaxID=480071 RepID=UPI00158D06AB|nr:alpha-L-fucosidase [Virgibacillus siamensis]
MSEKESDMMGIPGKNGWRSDDRVANWQKLAYGLFIHWGIYSKIGGVWDNQPVVEGYSEQIQMWQGISKEDYLRVAKQFSAEKFDPQVICQLAKDAGMKYIVFTTKHHDGFCMFDTKTTNYNIAEATPFGKDALSLLADECQKQGLKLGLYYSLVDWDQGHEFDKDNGNSIPASLEVIIKEQLKELLSNYGSIVELWFDMGAPTLDQSNALVSLVHEYQPEIMINSRVWNNAGDFRTLSDNEIPTEDIDTVWQTPASINHSTWGYRSWQQRDAFSIKLNMLIQDLVKVRAKGGNYLLNIGPRGDGSIVEYEEDILRAIGAWIKRHPGIINGNVPTKFPVQSWGHVMAGKNELYLYLTGKFAGGTITLPWLASPVLEITEDNTSQELKWERNSNDLIIYVPKQFQESIVPVLNVKLREEVRIIPDNVIAPQEGIWTISPDNVSFAHSYCDEGNYTSMKLSTVKLTAFLAAEYEQEVSIEFQGTANLEYQYHIQLGEQVKIVTGRELLGGMVGNFTVPAFEIVPLSITLADPVYSDQDLGVEVEQIVVGM